MTPGLKWLPAIGLLLLSTQLSAVELDLSAQEIKRLGIELATPDAAEHVAVVNARARVVIPPSGERVITAIYGGPVSQFHVGVGDVVKIGQTVATVQSSEFLTQQREYVDAYIADELARTQLQRDQQLFEEGIISKRRLDDTMARSKTVAAQLGEHKALLRIAGMLDGELSALATQQKFADQLTIRTPASGVVLERMGKLGERVDGLQPIYRIGDLSTLWLDIQVPQEQIDAVYVGMPVDVANSVVALPAEVVAIGQSVDSVGQTVLVRAKLAEPGHQLKPGQFVSVQIVSDSVANQVWAVPVDAIVRRDDQSYVFVRTDSGFAVREVTVANATGAKAHIDGRLTAHERIAVSGVSALKAIWSNDADSDN